MFCRNSHIGSAKCTQHEVDLHQGTKHTKHNSNNMALMGNKPKHKGKQHKLKQIGRNVSDPRPRALVQDLCFSCFCCCFWCCCWCWFSSRAFWCYPSNLGNVSHFGCGNLVLLRMFDCYPTLGIVSHFGCGDLGLGAHFRHLSLNSSGCLAFWVGGICVCGVCSTFVVDKFGMSRILGVAIWVLRCIVGICR